MVDRRSFGHEDSINVPLRPGERERLERVANDHERSLNQEIRWLLRNVLRGDSADESLGPTATTAG